MPGLLISIIRPFLGSHSGSDSSAVSNFSTGTFDGGSVFGDAERDQIDGHGQLSEGDEVCSDESNTSACSPDNADDTSTTTTIVAREHAGFDEVVDVTFTQGRYDRLLSDYNDYLARLEILATVDSTDWSDYPRITTGGNMLIDGSLLINQKHFLPVIAKLCDYYTHLASISIAGGKCSSPPTSTMFEHLVGSSYELRYAPGSDSTNPYRLVRAFIFLTNEIAASIRLFYRGTSIGATRRAYRKCCVFSEFHFFNLY